MNRIEKQIKHKNRGLEGTEKQVEYANDILDNLENAKEEAEKGLIKIKEIEAKNEKTEKIKEQFIEVITDVITGMDIVLKNKKASEIINIYSKNRYHSWAYQITGLQTIKEGIEIKEEEEKILDRAFTGAYKLLK